MSQAAPVTQEQADRVHTTVDYLPAPQPYQQHFDDDTQLSVLRSGAMAFFKVADHKDRDVHEFFLVYDGTRITNLDTTLEQLIGEKKREAKFELVEQITPGIA